MTTLDDIEKAVTELPADQLKKFRAWFEEFEAAHFDRMIEREPKRAGSTRLPSGRLPISAPAAPAIFETRREPVVLADVVEVDAFSSPENLAGIADGL